MKYLIYAHINKINYKYYICQTILDPKERWRNGKGYQRQPKFYRAIKNIELNIMIALKMVIM